MRIIYRGTSIDASYQISVHLGKRFQRRRFYRNQPIRNKNCLWRPFLLMDRDEMSNCNRGLSIDASYQVSIHLAKRFQRRRIYKICQSETRIACGGHVLTGRDGISNLYRGPSIDASYQVSVHLAKQFQRRGFKKNLYRDNCILNTDIYI